MAWIGCVGAGARHRITTYRPPQGLFRRAACRVERLPGREDRATGFELQEVDLRAEHEARVAGAEAEYQRKLMSLLTGGGFSEQSLQGLHAEAKAFSDSLFGLKRQSARALHEAKLANEEKKNTLWTEMDRRAIGEAEALGLTQAYSPVLAAPIGDGLTEQEERWNEREKDAVARLEERNAKTLSEFRTGAALRQWELENLEEDFRLEWEEKTRLHALDSDETFYNLLLMQSVQGGEADREDFIDRMTEANKQKTLITTEYRKIRDKNRITRREEKKRIQDGS